ncbi:MAG TPA: hypothetical protein VMV86_03495, partial [Methanosarcinales archaeon]|nr:hypothetical protein [Methanosarcinales archaeon]
IIMSFNETIGLQGRFVSTGNSEIIKVRSNIDWLEVRNYTVADDDTQTTAVGVEYFWQRGMAADTGFEYKKSNAANAAQLTTALASGGFSLLDSSADPVGAAVAITGASNVVRPIISTTSTAGLSAGNVVRLSGVTGATGLSGIDFSIDTLIANTSFRLAGALQQAQGAAGTAGFYRKISFDPLYYPRHRHILNITQAASAVVTLSVPSGYVVGDTIRFVIPSSIYGMTQLDGVLATVIAVDDTLATQTVTVDVDTTAMTAFAFPTAAQFAANVLSKAMVVPVGMDTAQAITSGVDQLGDATTNTGYLGMLLAAGADSPAGSTSDVIYWRAGKSFSVSNS